MRKHRRRDARSATHSRRSALGLRPPTTPGGRAASRRPHRTTDAPLLLEIAPPLHGNLAAIKLAILIVASLVGARLGARRLARVAPGEVVEVPEGVGGQDEVPDGQGDEVDEHPEDVDEAVRGDDDEDAGQAEDEEQEDQGNCGRGRVGEGRFEAERDWEGIVSLTELVGDG